MLMAEVYSFFFFSIIVGLGFLSQFFLHRLNTKALLVSQEDKYRGSFIGERAYQNLKILNNFGPKVVGSNANENLATNYILTQVNAIKSNAFNPDDIEIDHQITSSASRYGIYENLQNIVVQMQGESNHTLMINCHYDSVPGSPGASDDAVSCCVMIEVLRVLSQKSSRQRHTVVFLFNGSEEQGLQAAHAFITENQWRENVRAYLNLESTGSGGREILFRTGPKHDWLVRMYRESVPRPFGHAISEELFESGVIPSATDFEIFRDYGNVPGLDFAYVEDGWRYHTRYDSIDYIPLESIQYTGNNILALTLKIANSNELVDPPEGTYAIFFDYLGLFFISYTADAGVVCNYIVAILAFVIPFILQIKLKCENFGFVFFETLMSFVTIVISTVISAAICWGMAEIMNATDNTMSYYNTTFLAVGIYCSLALIVQIGTYHLIQFLTGLFLKTKKYREASKRHRVKISLNGVNLFWSVITLTLTAMGYRFAYITMILLFVSLCTYLLTYLVCSCLSKTTTQSWIFIHLLGHGSVFLFMCYMMIQLVELFIPITGKQYYANPDIIVALISVLWMVLCMSYFIPLTLLIRFRAVLYSSLCAIFVVSTILAFTSVGFPYSDNQAEPRLQRFRAIHLKRTVYDTSFNAINSYNNVMIYAWDRNAIRTLENTFGAHDIVYLQNDELCDQFHVCGFPHYPIDERTVSLKSFNAAPNIQPAKFNLISSTRNGNNVRIEFTLEFKTLTHLAVTCDEGLNFVSTNLPGMENFETNSKTVRAWLTLGLQLTDSFRVIFEYEGTPTTNILATISVKTIDSTFDQGAQEASFKAVMDKFPDYTFSYVQQADSSIYQIA